VSAFAAGGRCGETSPKLATATRASAGGLAALVVIASVGLVHAQSPLPAGAGADVIKARCVSCHETDLIASQRLGQAAWGRELDKMARWGAVVSAEQRDTLLTYLTAHFGPGPVASHASPSSTAPNAAPLPAGEATLKRACLGCHGMDLVEQQRLARAGWVREVDKMVRWGATVDAAEKDALVDHLTARFGPGRR
jgi:mono/diheme cytochrome c family protein